MISRDSFFKKREGIPAPRNVNVTPALGALGALGQPHDATARPAAPATIATRPETSQAPERIKSEIGSKLIVGPDIKLKGAEITDCDTLVVEGTVEASMDSRVVQIAEHGVFNGTVSIDIAEIHGRFDGELTARDQLIIHASGRVSGKIRYGKIKIEEGAEITGDIARIDRNDARPLRAAQPALKSAPA